MGKISIHSKVGKKRHLKKTDHLRSMLQFIDIIIDKSRKTLTTQLDSQHGEEDTFCLFTFQFNPSDYPAPVQNHGRCDVFVRLLSRIRG